MEPLNYLSTAQAAALSRVRTDGDGLSIPGCLQKISYRPTLMSTQGNGLEAISLMRR